MSARKAKKSSGKKVLLTGATTPLGRSLTQKLLEAGASTVLAVGAPRTERVGLPSDQRVQVVSVDLSRARERHRLLFDQAKDLGIDTLIHTATHRSPRATGLKAWKLNVEAATDLLNLAERHPTIDNFILRSFSEVYRLDSRHALVIDERHPLAMAPHQPQWLRDRVEADLMTASRVGLSDLRVVVLRCAECLAEGTGSQLWDFLQSRVCFRPLGYDPMLNLASVDDIAEALLLAALGEARGVFNIPGADTLPMSALIRLYGRREIPVPGGLMTPLYRLRKAVLRTDFRYDINRARLHVSGVLDGRRAQAALGYEPRSRLTFNHGPRKE